MRTISADYNAITESDQLRLSFRSAQEDLREARAQPEDWVWLSDGEVIVGAQLKDDPRYGLVGVPVWTTLVHLDDEDAPAFPQLLGELRDLRDQPLDTSVEGGARILRLLTLFEKTAPDEVRALIPPGPLARERAVALSILGQPGLALAEIEVALQAAPDDPRAAALYLELLRVLDLPRAVREAEIHAVRDRAEAMILAGCIRILATDADNCLDTELDNIVARLHDWLARFEAATGRDTVPASTLALVYFDVGQLALRRGDREQAQQFLQLAARANPKDSMIRLAAELVVFDQTAKDIVRAIHTRLSAA